MWFYLVIGSFLLLRGVLSLCGNDVLFSKRALEPLPKEEQLPYLRKNGFFISVLGIAFVFRAGMIWLRLEEAMALEVLYFGLLVVSLVGNVYTNELYQKKMRKK